jgi:hypothetical protein
LKFPAQLDDTFRAFTSRPVMAVQWLMMVPTTGAMGFVAPPTVLE